MSGLVVPRWRCPFCLTAQAGNLPATCINRKDCGELVRSVPDQLRLPGRPSYQEAQAHYVATRIGRRKTVTSDTASRLATHRPFATTKACPVCHATVPRSVAACQHCDYVFTEITR